MFPQVGKQSCYCDNGSLTHTAASFTLDFVPLFTLCHSPFFAAGREISCPEEEIQTDAARAPRQACRVRRGRPETSQSAGGGTVGRHGCFRLCSSAAGAAGRTGVLWASRRRYRGEFKTGLLFSPWGESAPTWGARHHSFALHRKDTRPALSVQDETLTEGDCAAENAFLCGEDIISSYGKKDKAEGVYGFT